MAGISRFEDLEAWQQARGVTRRVYEESRTVLFSKDFALRDQIRRATVSVMSNIAEGYERGRDRELVQFLIVAKGSCGEVRAQLYVALDQGYLTDQDFEGLVGQAERTSQLIAGLIRYLRRRTPNVERST